mgnify:CR=1 FL=1
MDRALRGAGYRGILLVAEQDSPTPLMDVGRLRDMGFVLIGLDGEADATLEAVLAENAGRPVALVLGAEGRGLRPRVAKTCDQLVHLPQMGRVDSLNVSVAAGIVCA